MRKQKRRERILGGMEVLDIFYLIRNTNSYWDGTCEVGLQYSREMYRKYTLTGTHVLNTHHYLISATQSDTREATLFHQFLASPHLPMLTDSNKIQSIIDDSQNQNVVNQNKNGFQVYFQQNLIQIRLKNGLILLSQLKQLSFSDIMEAIGLLNLDFAMSSKQISANNRHNQMMALNNSCKFYKYFLEQEEDQLVLPFLSLEEKKIHYYDLTYGGNLGQNKQSRKFSSKDYSNKKVQWNQEQSFHKYIYWLVKVLTCSSVTQFKEDLESNLLRQTKFEDIDKELKLIQLKFSNEAEKSLVNLLRKCFQNKDNYSINIFKKECQIIQERYSKLSMNHNQQQKSSKKIIKENRTSFIQTKKEMKTRLSKSFIDFNKKRLGEEEKSPIRRQSAGRLKYSRSQITLNKPSTSSLRKPGRKLKKATLNLFKSSKIDTINTSSNFFGDSGSLHFRKSKLNPTDVFTKSMNFNGMSSASSNWFATSMQESQLSGKLRNFKKGKNHITASNTPKHNIHEKHGSNVVIEDKDKIGEEQLSRFSTIYNNRSKAKGMIFKEKNESKQKIQQNSSEIPQFKDYSVHHQKNLQDQFTMTDTPKIQEKTISRVPQKRKTITNTLSLSVYDPQGQKEQKPKEVKESKSPKIKPTLRRQVNKENSQGGEQVQEIKCKISQKGRQENRNRHQNIFEAAQNIKEPKEYSEEKKKGKEQIKNISKHTQKSPQKHLITTKQELSQPKTIVFHPQRAPTVPKKSKKTSPFLPQHQKTFYLKHFQMVLKFCNEHKAIITLLPNSSNLTFLINFLYYKTLLQHINAENNSPYKKLLALLQKKQQKFQPKEKEEYLMYRIDCNELWNQSKAIKILEQKLITRLEEFIRGEEQISCPDQFETFLILSEEAVIFLEKQLNTLYKYLRTNKAMLINKGGFEVLLELGYMITVTSIMNHQRLTYYQSIQEHQFSKMPQIFNFFFQESSQQYIEKYRKNLKQKQLTFLDVQEEYSTLKNWISQYS